jgi:hypothetical protein
MTSAPAILPPPQLVAAPHESVTPFEHPEADLDAHPPEEPAEPDEVLGPVASPLAASDE